MDNHNLSGKPSAREDNSTAERNRKTSSTALTPQDQQVIIKCPRCDSPNTKFCYYNNYSLSQPRHFCKTCRRYWTKGGALRSVPIGGGCRKNKKVKSSSRLSSDSRYSSELGGLKFFQGLAPAMDFQLGGLSFSPPPTGIYNQNFFGGESGAIASSSSTSCFNLDSSENSGHLFGFNYGSVPEMTGPMNASTGLASSIESSSSLNQDLLWKLQQQRLAVIFGTGENNQDGAALEKPQPLPILFDGLEGSKLEAARNLRKGGEGETAAATEWFFGNSFAAAVATTPTNGGNITSGWNIGVPAGSTDLHQYSTLP